MANAAYAGIEEYVAPSDEFPSAHDSRTIAITGTLSERDGVAG